MDVRRQLIVWPRIHESVRSETTDSAICDPQRPYPRTEGWNRSVQNMPPAGSRCAGLCATRTRVGTHRRELRSSAAARHPSTPRRGGGKAGKRPIGGTDASTMGAAPTRSRRSVMSCVRSRLHRPGPWNWRTSLTPNAITMMSTGSLGTSGTSRVRATRAVAPIFPKACQCNVRPVCATRAAAICPVRARA